jgi:hypothetical protein
MKKHTYINKNGVKVYAKHIMVPEGEMELIEERVKEKDTNFSTYARESMKKDYSKKAK